MNTAHSSEMFVPIYQATRCHFPEESYLGNHHNENLKSCFVTAFRSDCLPACRLISKVHKFISDLLSCQSWEALKNTKHHIFSDIPYSNISMLGKRCVA